MKKEISKYNPDKKQPYFLFDPEGDGFVYFESENDRDSAADDAIQGYLVDEWDEQVTGVVVGKLTGQASMVDIEVPQGNVDEELCDEHGEYWDPDFDYKCSYKIQPLGFICPSTDKLKDKEQ